MAGGNTIYSKSMERRHRSSNFDSRETRILVSCIRSEMNVIENKQTDGATLTAKRHAWGRVSEQFNRRTGTTHRSVDTIKLKYDNLKRGLRKKLRVDANALPHNKQESQFRYYQDELYSHLQLSCVDRRSRLMDSYGVNIAANNHSIMGFDFDVEIKEECHYISDDDAEMELPLAVYTNSGPSPDNNIADETVVEWKNLLETPNILAADNFLEEKSKLEVESIPSTSSEPYLPTKRGGEESIQNNKFISSNSNVRARTCRRRRLYANKHHHVMALVKSKQDLIKINIKSVQADLKRKEQELMFAEEENRRKMLLLEAEIELKRKAAKEFEVECFRKQQVHEAVMTEYKLKLDMMKSELNRKRFG